MKRCSKCGVEKSLDLFDNNKNRADGKQGFCKECKKEYNQKYHVVNKDRYSASRAESRKARAMSNREKIGQILNNSCCTDCGNTDRRVLEFDHLRDKTADISTMVHCAWSWSTIEKEIEKCEIVCANCHRIRTIERLAFVA